MRKYPATRPRLAWLLASVESSGLVVQAVWRTGTGWLLPVVLALLLIAAVLAVIASTGPLAPFVNPLF